MNYDDYNENDELDLDKVVLDSYFSSRANNDVIKGSYVPDCKTTQEIIDDLNTTLELKDRTVVEYLIKHGYILENREDGTPVWRIFRMK